MKFIDDLNLKNKTVLLRADLNVPLDDEGNITDSHRIRASLPTIQFARQHGAKVVVASHLGRPKGKVDPKLSLQPVAKRLSELTGVEVQMAPDCIGESVKTLKKGLKPGEILLLENVRFHSGETKNDPEFAKSLSSGVDCFVNDAFGTAHRAHASTVGVVDFIDEKAGGFTLRNEIEYFDKCLQNPKHPLVAIFGGAKVSSKLGAIYNVASRADAILIGGAMANTFFAAKGLNVGKSMFENELLAKAKETEEHLQSLGCKLYLPKDLVVAKEFKEDASTRTTPADGIESDEMALDIGPETVKQYSELIQSAQTVVWNGPMGVLEMDSFATGTFGIVDAVTETKALTVVGGGDTDLALHKKSAFQKVSYVSTGGGAFLVLLEGNSLYAVEALKK